MLLFWVVVWYVNMERFIKHFYTKAEAERFAAQLRKQGVEDIIVDRE
jgi:hypothetical protein